jgi:hypothetical protein
VIRARLEGKSERLPGSREIADLGERAPADDLELDPFAGVAHARQPRLEKRGERLAIGGRHIDGLQPRKDVQVGHVDLGGGLERRPPASHRVDLVEKENAGVVACLELVRRHGAQRGHRLPRLRRSREIRRFVG